MIEKKLWTLMVEEDGKKGSARYKSKYRSLLFNLSDPKNSLSSKLINGDLSIENLMKMESRELANEDVGKEIEYVLENTVAASTPQTESTFLKKTHKGEEYIGGGGGSSLPSSNNNKERDNDTLITSPIIEPTDAKSFSPFTEWQGKIFLPEVTNFSAQIASFTTNSQIHKIKPYLPNNFHIFGRIPVERASKYLSETQKSPNRICFVFPIFSAGAKKNEMSEAADEKYTVLLQFLIKNNRWAVVVSDPKKGVIDFYLAPIDSKESLDALMPKDALLEKIPNNPATKYPILFGVMVSRKSGRRREERGGAE